MKPGLLVRLLTLAMALLFFFPTIIVVGTSLNEAALVQFPPKEWSFRWYPDVFDNSAWVAALWSSLKVGVVAGVTSMVVGTLLALGAARSRLLPHQLVTALAMAPVAVPTVVAGLGFYIATIKVGLEFDSLALGVAHSTLGVPFVFVNVLAALTTIDPKVEEAARIFGASEVVTLWKVTIPLILPGAAIGGVLAFIGSWDEVIVSSFMTSPTFSTVPVEMFSSVREGATPATSAVATMVTVVTLALLGLVAAATAPRSRTRERRAK